MKRLILVVPLLAAFGCAHAPVKTAAHETADSSSTKKDPNGDGVCSVDGDCKANQLCIRAKCVAISNQIAECSAARVHFTFNSAEIEPADRPLIERSARCLRSDQALHVTVEGNADERGTEEYNLALGDQRATMVAKYLRTYGASDSQLKTVSYGKERPLCTDHDEACWSQNRRAAIDLAAAQH